MIVKSVIVCLSLAAALPISAAPAPLATSTVIRIPDLVTLTAGFVAPTEIPNLTPAPTGASSAAHRLSNMDSTVPGLSGAAAHIPGADSLAMGGLPILRRQIRINNYDATNNSMTEPLLGAAPHLLARGNKKANAIEAARQKNAVAAAAVPTSAPAAGGPLGAAAPMKAVAGGIQGLGATRLEGSDMFHEALGEVFNPDAALQSAASTSASAPKPTDVKAATPLPVGPGYTTDTMDTTPEKALTKAQAKTKRHSFMMDFNSLLPEPETESAKASPVQAWQNGALFELDSNRKPDPKLLTQNITMAASNVTDTAKGATGNATKSA